MTLPLPDETDLQIIHLLRQNPRIPVSQLARSVKLTDNAVRYRIKRMEARGILREIVILVDPAVVGEPQLGLLLAKLRDPLDLAAVLAQTPEVVGAYKCQGEYNACLFVRGRDPDDLERIARDLPARAPVDEVRLLPVVQSYRLAPTLVMPETSPRDPAAPAP